MKFPSRLIIAAVLAAPLSFGQSTAYTVGVMSLNPLGYWKLDGNLNDAGPGHNNGANTNLPNPIGFTLPGGGAPIDPNGQAGVFNSSKVQSIIAPAGNTFNFVISQPFTLMAWIKTANQGLSPMIIVGKVDANLNGYALVVNNGPGSAPQGGGRLALIMDSQGALSQVQSNVPVNDVAWHFVVAVNDGSGLLSNIQLYVDGARVNTTSGTAAGPSFSSTELAIGGMSAGGSFLPFEGLIDEVAVLGYSVTQAQIQNVAGFASGARKIMPQFAFGGGWYSAIYFSNTGTATVSFPVNFTTDIGTPMMNVPLITGGATTVTLAPGASTVIEAPNFGTGVTQGYASFIPPPGIVGYGVFRQTLPPVPPLPAQEAVVPFSSASTTTSTLLWDDRLSVTAIAIANPSAIPVNVTVTVTNFDGSVIGIVTLPTLAANAHTAFLLKDVVNGIPGNRGTAVFSVTSGNIALLGLRATGIALTSIPTADK